MTTWVLFVFLVSGGSPTATALPGFYDLKSCQVAGKDIEAKTSGMTGSRATLCIEQTKKAP